MPTVSRISHQPSVNAEDEAYVSEVVRGYKVAAARGCFIASLFFTLRVVFSLVVGTSPSLATSLVCAGLALAIVVGCLAVAAQAARKPSYKRKEAEHKYVLG